MAGAVKWTEKYRPVFLKEILGNSKAISELHEWALAWEHGVPITGATILFGPAGVGKTSAALALAREMDWEYIEMNASDIRTAGSIEHIAGPASKSSTFSGNRRLVVLDEADNLHGNADRGGAAAMLRLVRNTSQPVILIANEYYEIERPLRDAAKGIQFRSIRSSTIASALREICKKEGVACDPDALELIAERAGGDLRSAVNDLQAAATGQSELRLEDVATAERDVKASIFKVLEVIFKGSDAVQALQASYSLDESPEDLVHWIDENLPLVYEGEDLFKGYDSLSKADVFLGRVRKRQSYGLWRYAGFLMTAGVQAARETRRHGYIAFRPPGLWRRMGQSRKARNIRDSAAKKIAQRCHVSAAFARAELMNFIGFVLKNRRLAPRVAAELDLDAEEIALLTGSTSTTQKVQTIFEEAKRIREEERVEDIEFAWHGSGRTKETVQGSTTPQETVQHGVKAGAHEAVKASHPEPETKGKEAQAHQQAKVGKRQRSLFEF
jgi:replication factor C large subunit